MYAAAWNLKKSCLFSSTAYITFESEDAAQTAYELGQGVTDIATTLKVEYMKGLKSSKGLYVRQMFLLKEPPVYYYIVIMVLTQYVSSD